tara:strand:- start:16058 stop:16831 length:774 start_codon:yes stop_codon:yes gene_type:complete
MYVLIKQKQAWKTYADKRKMRYHSSAMLETPSISGVVDGYSVTMFASEHGELDARSQRRLTAIEVMLQTNLPFAVGAASGGMVHVVEALDLRQEFKPPTKGWDDTYALRTSDLPLAQSYLNEGRLSKLVNLMKTDRAWIIFLFLGDQGVLRLDTPMPIDNPKEIDVLVKQMINVARALELGKGEGKDLIRQTQNQDKAGGVLEIDEDLLNDDIGFELEDEEADLSALDDKKATKADAKSAAASKDVQPSKSTTKTKK